MNGEISQDQRRWLTRISDAVAHAVESGLDAELVIDAVAIGLELEERTAFWGGSPLSMSLARAFSSSVGPDGGSGSTEVTTSSAGPSTPAPCASAGTPRAGHGPAEDLHLDDDRPPTGPMRRARMLGSGTDRLTRQLAFIDSVFP